MELENRRKIGILFSLGYYHSYQLFEEITATYVYSSYPYILTVNPRFLNIFPKHMHILVSDLNKILLNFSAFVQEAAAHIHFYILLHTAPYLINLSLERWRC